MRDKGHTPLTTIDFPLYFLYFLLEVVMGGRQCLVSFISFEMGLTRAEGSCRPGS